MVERSGSISRYYQEDWNTNKRYEVDREEEDELNDLPKAERTVYGRATGLSKRLDGILCARVDDPALLDQIFKSLRYQNSVKHVYQSLVDEEGFEKQCNDRS